MHISRKILQQLADSASFTRGEDYFKHGLVKDISRYENKIIAKVLGTKIYHVKLWEDQKQLQYDCSCPVGDEGAFCKHCVAVGLTWLEKSKNETVNITITLDDIRGWLFQQNKDTLADLIMEQVVENDRLMQKLSLKVAKSQAAKINISAYQHTIDQAVATGSFIDYYQASDYADGLSVVVDSIEELLHEKQADAAMQLVEYMLPKVEEAINYIDDSNGEAGSILCRLEELFYQACLQVKPDVKALAQKLFRWELQTQWDTFYGAAEKYAELLGGKGLAVYQALAEAEWQKIKPLKPGEEDKERYGKRFRITKIMETLARRTGDVEALVAIKKHDLSHSYAYLQIAETYRAAKQTDKAIQWAEQGIKDFSKNPDARLQDFLAEEYHRVGQHEKALNQVWQQFLTSESLFNYQKLKQYADYSNQWSYWREKAITQIRETLDKHNKKASAQRGWRYNSDHSLLVEIFLWEKDAEAAWAEAKAGGCTRHLWLELAGVRGKSHPQDAIAIYQAEIEPTLDLKNNEAYAQTIHYLKKINKLMGSLGQKQVFADYLATLRINHKPKRNFMKLLDQANW